MLRGIPGAAQRTGPPAQLVGASPELCLTWDQYPKGQASGLSWVPGTQSGPVTRDSWYVTCVSTHQPEPPSGRRAGNMGKRRKQSSVPGEASHAAEMGKQLSSGPGLAGQGQGGDQLCGFCRKLPRTARDGWGNLFACVK